MAGPIASKNDGEEPERVLGGERFDAEGVDRTYGGEEAVGGERGRPRSVEKAGRDAASIGFFAVAVAAGDGAGGLGRQGEHEAGYGKAEDGQQGERKSKAGVVQRAGQERAERETEGRGSVETGQPPGPDFRIRFQTEPGLHGGPRQRQANKRRGCGHNAQAWTAYPRHQREDNGKPKHAPYRPDQGMARAGHHGGGCEAGEGVHGHLDGAHGAGERGSAVQVLDDKKRHGGESDGDGEVEEECRQVHPVVRSTEGPGHQDALSAFGIRAISLAITTGGLPAGRHGRSPARGCVRVRRPGRFCPCGLGFVCNAFAGCRAGAQGLWFRFGASRIIPVSRRRVKVGNLLCAAPQNCRMRGALRPGFGGV